MTQPIIVLTRDRDGNARLAAKFTPTNAPIRQFPLFEVQHLDLDPISLKKNIIITSRHAAECLSQLDMPADAACYVVGSESAEILENAGANIALQTSNAAELTEGIRLQGGGPYSYLRGKHVNLDITSELAKHGATIEEHVVYEYKTNLAQAEQLKQFVRTQTDPLIFPLLSARTANVVAEILFDHPQDVLLHALALSRDILHAVDSHPWTSTMTSEEMNLNSLAKACLNYHNSISLNHYE